MGRKKLPLPEGVISIIDDGDLALSRKCPSCNNDIIYKGKSRRWNVKLAIKNNNVCTTCANIKKQGSIPWNKGIPMTEEAKAKQRQVKLGKPIHTSEFKEYMRNNSVFCQKGEKSMTIQRLLKNEEISYEEYLSTKQSFHLYKRAVWHVTKQQDISILPNIEKRGRQDIDLNAYHLDHIISIKEGYKQNIPADQIGHISNLQMIPWLENIKKGTN